MKKIDQPKWNMLLLLLVVGICTLLVVNGDFSNGRGMALLIIGLLPLFIGIVTAILYGLSRLLFKKYNWIITLLGILYLLSASLQFFFE